jgi:hypothetical protein
VIKPYQVGADEDLARELLIMARSIAPCISGFADDSEEQKTAISIIKRVYVEVEDRGSRNVKSERTGTGAVEWIVRSAFDGDPRASLRALCAAAGPAAGQPMGSFPAERPMQRLWPETYR